MVEIKIPDINENENENISEPVIICPFTYRQIICIFIACMLAIPTFLGLSHFVSRHICLIIILFEIIPFIFLGWIKPCFINEIVKTKKLKITSISDINIESDNLKIVEISDFDESNKSLDDLLSEGKSFREISNIYKNKNL